MAVGVFGDDLAIGVHKEHAIGRFVSAVPNPVAGLKEATLS